MDAGCNITINREFFFLISRKLTFLEQSVKADLTAVTQCCSSIKHSCIRQPVVRQTLENQKLTRQSLEEKTV